MNQLLEQLKDHVASVEDLINRSEYERADAVMAQAKVICGEIQRELWLVHYTSGERG